jgi:hypothetical protein
MLPGSFHSVEVNDNIDLELTHDTTRGTEVTITGGENLLEYVTTDMADSVLTLRVETQCDWLRNLRQRIQVRLNMRTPLKGLTTNWTSTARSTDSIPTRDLYITHNSTGDLNLVLVGTGVSVIDLVNLGSATLAGDLPVLVPVVYDMAEVNTYNLHCGYLFLYHYSTAEARIAAEKYIGVTNYENATVRWRGTAPERVFLNPGGGQFIEEN